MLLQGKIIHEGTSQEFRNLAISNNYSSKELTKYVTRIQNAAQPVKYLGTLLKSSLKSFGLSAVQFVLFSGVAKHITLAAIGIDQYVNRIVYAQEAAKSWEETLKRKTKLYNLLKITKKDTLIN